MNLEAAAESPADVLAGLYFVDGDDTSRCRTDRIVAAFTAPGSHLIQVCGQRFFQFAVKTKGGEILLIHDLLHFARTRRESPDQLAHHGCGDEPLRVADQGKPSRHDNGIRLLKGEGL